MKVLVVLLIALAVIYCKTPLPMEKKVYIRREHSLIKPYSSMSMDTPMWDYSGSTIVSNNEIRLTPDHQSKAGRVWNTIPLMSRNWEILMEFKVHGQGRTLYGDGFALWYSHERQLMAGPVFGAKNGFNGLGIFFDTYSNHNGEHSHGHPYISAVVHNGTQTYDHDSDGTHNELAGCQCSFRGQKHDTFVSIKYINNILTVHTDVRGKSKWTKCFEVKNVVLPVGYHLGLSASTGDLADNHDVKMLKLYEVDLVEGQTYNVDEALKLVPSAEGEPDRPHVHPKKTEKGSSVLWTIFYIFITLVIVFSAIGIGIIVWQKKQEDRRRKRFF
ncbi:hypothetical protein ACHWQZ_G008706 [Mnemiopsis leidyi]